MNGAPTVKMVGYEAFLVMVDDVPVSAAFREEGSARLFAAGWQACRTSHNWDCHAKIYLGPGHQSSATCERKDRHAGDEDDPHLAHHPRTRAELQWQGPEGMTGYFDESPL